MNGQYIANFLDEKYELYENAVKKIRGELSLGNSYDHACDTLTDLDQEMKDFVKEDFLKILIAEEYFGGALDIADMALLLGLPYDRIKSSMHSLLQDMVNETNMQNLAITHTTQ
ncbi:MAG: hypothetical protein OEY01_07210 [Desulfobulbaceae bacterium]|nr:hypothetical protein [Desulfobulbaceae bacterium]HIJ78843.1 hypothetical protein [Deltaproteobacteria bacterium]